MIIRAPQGSDNLLVPPNWYTMDDRKILMEEFYLIEN